MRVSFNPNIGLKTNVSSSKKEAIGFAQAKTKEEEQIEAFSKKTKRAVLTCFSVALAVNIIYFALCKNFKTNRQRKFEQSLVDIAKSRKKAVEQNRVPAVVLNRPTKTTVIT